ncbi:MAG TPA: uroporphyrinogen decarboxylase family protein [Armatimonadota bacterium]|jgi:uroporphyrinogen decarboxylase
MTSRERVRRAFEHRSTDRVPCFYSAETEPTQALYQHFGISDHNELLRILGCDTRTIGVKYVGPAPQTYPDGSKEGRPGGPRSKVVQSKYGDIATPVYWPWATVKTAEDLATRDNWAGDPEWWDYSEIPAQMAALDAEHEYWLAASVADPASPQHMMMWRGEEQFMLDLALNPDLAKSMIKKQNEGMIEKAILALEAGGGRYDELQWGGDLGTQESLFISVKMWREFFREYYLEFYAEIVRHFGTKLAIFYHSCGAVWDMIPDLIDVGVRILNPIQVRAKNMDPRRLKDEFGGVLTFHGAIDIQHVLPHCTADEVRRHTEETIEILGAGGGYVCGPNHAIQADTSVENILAVYETVQGRKIG